MDRISHLSLHQSIEDATALTAEHLELLKSIDQAEMLWMGNNNSKQLTPRNDQLIPKIRSFATRASSTRKP